MKVLLIKPADPCAEAKYREYPLGLGYLATSLNRNGNSCQILDVGVDDEPLEERIAVFNPGVVGISALSVTFPAALDVMKEVRKKFDGPIVAGGAHSSMFPKEVIGSGFDFAVIGEGERTMQELIDNLNNPGGIRGLAYRRGREIVVNQRRPELRDLDSLPFPDRNLFNLSLYTKHTVMSSRGCTFNCKFCANEQMGGRLTRTRSARNIFEELVYIYQDFGARNLFFADDNFGLYKRVKMEMCNLLEKSGIKLDWAVQMRADSVDETLLESMRRAGCRRVYFGVESGSQEILDEIGKKIKLEQIRRAISTTKRTGLSVKVGLIVGLPGTYEQNLESISLMKETMPDEVIVYHFVPFPGTEYWRNSERYGIHIADPQDLSGLYYYGIPRNLSFDYISQEQIMNLFELFETELKKVGYHGPDTHKAGDRLIVTPLSRHLYVQNKAKLRHI